jgi:DNA repair protein RecO (recombination protein O)
MEWTDRGIVLSSRRHGEGSTIVELLTEAHGRHLGLARGGTSARLRSALQPGNTLEVTWRARLADHLGHLACEVMRSRAATLIAGRERLAGLQTLAALAHLLPEREPAASMYEVLELVLDAMLAGDDWPALVVRFELGLLTELGFGIDLTSCAATGLANDLAYVSPRSRRAVSRSAGAPYHDRLLALPGFLVGRGGGASAQDLAAGFRLTGHFLVRDVFGPRGMPAPEARARLIALVAG